MAARRGFHTLPGRPPAVRFPIMRTEVCQGQEFRRVLEEGSTVRCIRCGKRIRVNSTTAIRHNDALDDMEYIRCLECGYLAAVLDYFDRVETRPRRYRVPEDAGPSARIRTPEDREG